MPSKTHKKGWGGKRANSGRPKELKDAVSRSIRLERETIEKIEELGYTLSDFYRIAGDRYLRYVLRKKKP